jgi:hypothetical protein
MTKKSVPLTLIHLGALGLVLAGQAEAQPVLRRDAPVQPLQLVRKGELLVGAGVGYEADVKVPLIAVGGDLARWGVLQLSYGVADGVVITVQGDSFRELSVDSMGTLPTDSLGVPLVTPDDGLADGKSAGAGDFRVGIAFRIFGADRGPFVGGRFQFNVPDSNQAEGLGTNSMMMRASVLGGYGNGPLDLTADLGIAILEAPAESFEQNDVVAYSAELLYTSPRPSRLRLFAAADGRASTRGRVPPGTEDLGDVGLQ